MNETEKILEKFARKNMIQWNQDSFKRTHSRLHKTVIEAINEALNLHNVIGCSSCGCREVDEWYDKTRHCAYCQELL